MCRFGFLDEVGSIGLGQGDPQDGLNPGLQPGSRVLLATIPDVMKWSGWERGGESPEESRAHGLLPPVPGSLPQSGSTYIVVNLALGTYLPGMLAC